MTAAEKNVSDVGIILPTYCEVDNIENIIRTIENLNLRMTLAVIDDSSPDGTTEIVKRLKEEYNNIIILNRPRKSGLGTAITDGFNLFLSQNNKPKYIITMDADSSHNPTDILKLINQARKGYDVVIGSRYCTGGAVKGWTITRWTVSRVANKLAKTILKLPINDYTSGFRCYSKNYVEKVLPKLHSQTYEIQIETLRQAKLQNSKVGEACITFQNRKKGKSKLTITEIGAFTKYILKALSN